MRTLKITAFTLAAALAAIFIYQNAAVVQFNFFAWEYFMSAGLFLMDSLFAGMYLGLLLSFWKNRRRIKTIHYARIQRYRSNNLFPGRV